jgi:hypothetical protein
VFGVIDLGGGTAIPGTDHPDDVIGFTLTGSSVVVPIPTTNDTLPENNETIRVKIRPDGNYDITAPYQCDITLLDNDTKPTLTISVTDNSATEREATETPINDASITISRGTAQTFPLQVNIALTDSGATAVGDPTGLGGDFISSAFGVDPVTTASFVTILGGSASVTIPIRAVADKRLEGIEVGKVRVLPSVFVDSAYNVPASPTVSFNIKDKISIVDVDPNFTSSELRGIENISFDEYVSDVPAIIVGNRGGAGQRSSVSLNSLNAFTALPSGSVGKAVTLVDFERLIVGSGGGFAQFWREGDSFAFNHQLSRFTGATAAEARSAASVNGVFTVVGFSNGTPPGGTSGTRAAIWQPDVTTSIDVLPHPTSTTYQADDINSSGWVVGSINGGLRTGLVWKPDGGGEYGHPVALPHFNQTADSFAISINNQGVVVGGYSSDFFYGAMWVPNGSGYSGISLGSATGTGNQTVPISINNAGQVAGYVSVPGLYYGMLWMNNKFTILNDLLPPNSGFSYVGIIYDINDAGVMVGWAAKTNGQWHAVVIRPL